MGSRPQSSSNERTYTNLLEKSLYSALPVCNRVDISYSYISHTSKFFLFYIYRLPSFLKTPVKMALSKIRTNFHASYVYMSMAAYFDRDDVALHGFAKRFRENSDEEREHAEKFIKYQNMRGGRVVFQDIAKARTDEWTSALTA